MYYIYIYIYIYIRLPKVKYDIGAEIILSTCTLDVKGVWGRTAKSSRLPGSKFQGLQCESRPRPVVATFENGDAWIRILCISEN